MSKSIAVAAQNSVMDFGTWKFMQIPFFAHSQRPKTQVYAHFITIFWNFDVTHTVHWSTISIENFPEWKILKFCEHVLPSMKSHGSHLVQWYGKNIEIQLKQKHSKKKMRCLYQTIRKISIYKRLHWGEPSGKKKSHMMISILVDAGLAATTIWRIRWKM